MARSKFAAAKGAAAKAAPAAHAVGKGKGKVPSPAYVKAAVAKTLREQFKSFDDFEVDAKLYDGRTLRQRLSDDRVAYWLASASDREVKLGPAYYAMLRRAYADKVHLADTLAWDRSDERNKAEVPEKLIACFDAFNLTHPNRSPLQQYLKECKGLTNKDL